MNTDKSTALLEHKEDTLTTSADASPAAGMPKPRGGRGLSIGPLRFAFVLFSMIIAFTSFTGMAFGQSTLTNGGNHTSTISAPAEIDLWTFEAAKDDTITVSIGEVATGEVNTGFYPWIRLRGPSGTQLATDTGALAAQVNVTAPLTGTYTVQVGAYYPDKVGTYRITLAQTPRAFVVPAGDEGGPLTNGANHSGVISLADLDQWTFQAAKDDTITVSIGETGLTEINTGFYPWIRLRGPNGAQLATDTGNLAGQVNVTAPLSGTYTVLVGSYYVDKVGSYRLTLARTPGAFVVPGGDEGGPMTNGANHTGVIPLADVDQWTFQAARNDTISVSIGEVVVGETNTGFYPWIRLRGPNGVQLATDTGNLAGQVTVTAPLTGTYTVLVGSYYVETEGRYQLTLAKTPAAFVVPGGDEGGLLTNGANHTGVIHLADLDQWTFQAAKNTSITVSIGEVVTGETNTGFYPWIRLRGPNGAQLGSDTGDLAAQINEIAPLTGTYTVLVGAYYVDKIGSYRLTVANTPGAFVVPGGDEGGPLTNGSNYSGLIPIGDLDQWTFRVAKNTAISINIAEVAESEIDAGFYPWIRLRGPNGAQLASDAGNISARINLTAPLTGTYTVVVGGYYTDRRGRYSISTANVGSEPPVISYTFPDRGGQSWSSQAVSENIAIGYARLDQDGGSPAPGALAIFGFRQGGVLVTEAGVPASTTLQSGRIYAAMDGPVNTGLALANPNDQAATVSFFFTGPQGDFGHANMTIPAYGQRAAFLNQTPFNGPSTLSGTFTFNASVPISVIALRGLTNERNEFLITTLPVANLATQTSADPLIFPHFAVGDGWTTQIVLVNPTDDVLTGSVEFRGKQGEAVAVSVNGATSTTLSYSIPARGSQKLAASATSPLGVTGSVRIVPAADSVAPSGLTIFSFQPNGITVAEAGVPAVSSAAAFRLYAETSGELGNIGSIQTGLAITNSSSTPTTVTLELTRLNGTSTGLTGTVQVPGNGQTALFLDQVPGLGSLPLPFQGVVRISSASPISVLGLRGRYNERGDFLITTTPPVAEGGAPPSGTLFFPHIVDGGGYTTQFILFSGGAGQYSGTMQLFSQSGAALDWPLR